MSYTKTEKMHIRLTEDIAREVRAVADLEHRPIQDQLRFFIVLGIKAFRSGVQVNGDERRRPVSPTAAQIDFPEFEAAPPRAANRRVVSQRKQA